MKLSIIIPVYNVENYIYDCLESILKQNIDKNDFEIIIVDDCGTDRSMAIVNDFIIRNSEYNISIIKHEKNKGLSGARNTGINVSQGDFLMFLDSDDFLCENSLYECLKTIDTKKLDVLEFGYTELFETSQNISVDCSSTFNNKILTGKEYFNFMIRNKSYTPMVWTRIYCTKFLKENSLYFKDRLISEDEDFTPRMLMRAKSVLKINKNVYMYRRRDNSITTMFNRDIKWVESYIYIIESLYELSKHNKTSKKSIKLRASQLNTSLLKNIVKYNIPEENRKKIIQLIKDKKMYKYSLFCQNFQNICQGILMIKPNLFIFLYHFFVKEA